MNNYDKIVNFYLAMFYYLERLYDETNSDDFSLDNKNFFKFNNLNLCMF